MDRIQPVPPENIMTKMAPAVMIMGAMVTFAALTLAFVASGLVSTALAGDTADAETLQEFGAYVMPLALTGVMLVLMAITIFLHGIFKGIRLMGTNATTAIQVLIREPGDGAPGPAAGTTTGRTKGAKTTARPTGTT